MESNNFEQEVRKRMGEFKLAPQEEVWARIEKEIASKKGTHKGILLILLLALISAGGFWWMTYKKPTSKSPSTFENLLNKQNRHEASEINSAAKNPETKNNNVLKSPKPSANISSAQTGTASIKLIKIFSGRSNSSASPKSLKTIKAKSKNHSSEDSSGNFVSANESQNSAFNDIHVSPNIIEHPLNSDLLMSKTFQSQTLNIPPKLSPDLKKPINKKHFWKFGFTFSGGSSWIESMESPALPAYNPQTSGFNAGSYYYMPGYVAYRPGPSSFQSSLSFTAGVFAGRNLSSKTNISVGLSYLQFSIQSNVRNNFEFAEVPVLFHFQVKRNVRFPITLDAGFSAAQMVGSNAQQYNYLYGRWYHDNDLFNKFQANFQAGFSLSVFNRHEREIRFGPGFYYGLIPLANHGIFDGKHLHVLNIHVELLLGEK